MLDFAQHLLLAISQLARCARRKAQGLGHGQPLRARVAGHDNDSVAEVNSAALAIGQAPILHNLQQQIENIGMRLFDFVQQHHAVGLATNGVRQLSALIVAHITRRRADEAGRGVLFHILTHIKAQHRSFVTEELLRQRFRQLGFTHTSGSKEEEGAHRAIFILKARPRTAYCLAYGQHSLVLTNHTLSQPTVQLQQLRAFAFRQLGQRNARPRSHHLGHILTRDGHGFRCFGQGCC